MVKHSHHHDHHKHEHPSKGAEKQANEVEERLEEKTLHAHEKAMPHGEDTPPPHDEHVGHAGHGDHHQMMIEDFKRRFWVSLILSIPVIVLSPMVQHILDYSLGLEASIQLWISFGLSTIIYFYGGWPFLTGLVEEVKKGSPGMMTLIGIGISVAYFYSTATVFGLEGMDFFWELATLIVVMLLGHWIEMKSVLGASKALELLVSMMPAEAHVIRNGETVKVRIDELQKGDVILVRPCRTRRSSPNDDRRF